MFRWPTSELPIWPAARPTRSSEASIVAVRARREQPVPVRHGGARDRVVGRIVAAAEAVEDQQDDRTRGRRAGGRQGGGGSGEVRVCHAIGGSRMRDGRGRIGAYAIILPLLRRRRRACRPIPRQRTGRSSWVRAVSGAMLLWPLVAAPAVADARNRHVRGDAAHQRQNALMLDMREPKEFDGRAAAERDAHSVVAAAGRGNELAQVRLAAADRLLRPRQAQPEAARDADQAGFQGDLQPARRGARVGRRRAADGEDDHG